MSWQTPNHFDQGVWFVELAQSTNLELILQALPFVYGLNKKSPGLWPFFQGS